MDTDTNEIPPIEHAYDNPLVVSSTPSLVVFYPCEKDRTRICHSIVEAPLNKKKMVTFVKYVSSKRKRYDAIDNVS